jgi:hypothetical protein
MLSLHLRSDHGGMVGTQMLRGLRVSWVSELGETAMSNGAMTGKPLIESSRVDGTIVHNQQGNNVGSIKPLH